MANLYRVSSLVQMFPEVRLQVCNNISGYPDPSMSNSHHQHLKYMGYSMEIVDYPTEIGHIFYRYLFQMSFFHSVVSSVFPDSRYNQDFHAIRCLKWYARPFENLPLQRS